MKPILSEPVPTISIVLADLTLREINEVLPALESQQTASARELCDAFNQARRKLSGQDKGEVLHSARPR